MQNQALHAHLIVTWIWCHNHPGGQTASQKMRSSPNELSTETGTEGPRDTLD